MPLSCSCDFDAEPGQKVTYGGSDFEPLETKKRKRCKSCKELIDIGSFCVRFDVYKIPEYEVEINIYGEDGEMPMADIYFCETCGEIYHNLESVGFCVLPWDDMREMLRDYQHDYAPPKLNIKERDSEWRKLTKLITDGLKKPES
jgi:hypothetical protein